METNKFKGLPIYKNKKDGDFLLKKDIVDNFPKNFAISEDDSVFYKSLGYIYSLI